MISLVTKLPKEILDFFTTEIHLENLRDFSERKLRPLTLLNKDEEKIKRFSKMISN